VSFQIAEALAKINAQDNDEYLVQKISQQISPLTSWIQRLKGYVSFL